jgi:hypothetical protein
MAGLESIDALAQIVSGPAGGHWLEDALDSMRPGFSVAEKAVVLQALTAPTKSSLPIQLAEQLAQGDLERRHPWRTLWRTVTDARDTCAATSPETIVAAFADAAKVSGIDPTSAMLFQALALFSPSEQHAFAAALVLHPGLGALQIFNVIAASRGGDPDNFIDARGEAILRLTTPLWPAEGPFAALRVAQLTRQSPSGGGHDSPYTRGFAPGPTLGLEQGVGFFASHSSFSKEGNKGHKGHRSGNVDGGGYIPVGELNGALYADTTTVESAFAASQQEVGRLRAQIGGLERKLQRLQQPRGQANPQPQQQQQFHPPQQQQHFQPPQQQQQQQAQRPQRAWRGRGAGRGVSGGDVETTPDF